MIFLIEKDHLGDRSPENDCGFWLTFRQPVRKPSSESSDSLSQLKIQQKVYPLKRYAAINTGLKETVFA